MTTIVNMLVGGPTVLWPDSLKHHAVKGPWIGVDRGTLRLLDHGVTPAVAVGDFDSLRPGELDRVRRHITDIRQSVPEKDETDTELGVTIAINEFAADRLDIYGATGGRLDHELANLFMVLKPRYKKYAPHIRFIDRQNTISFYLPGEYEIAKEPDKKYLAFIPLTAIDHLTLPDEKYTLQQEPIPFPISFASNEFLGDRGTFSFDTGLLCVIQSNDLQPMGAED
ncbi:thiamine diphosphokinase [Levilactobacillus bambusae]|uniref:Thiamine diphosphokinase n=1 Tax=Levilactobacillus bambusae TaxID=2024736 RepID=A0A2V1N1L9_9LACO|nr:thiamine diphosphokinase [Levilactobacillus bambusae]PWG00913.1 thiamine diphosphokinase [Levilactobacillus bambusae]